MKTYIQFGDMFGFDYAAISKMNQMRFPYYHVSKGLDAKGQIVDCRSENSAPVVDYLRVVNTRKYDAAYAKYQEDLDIFTAAWPAMNKLSAYTAWLTPQLAIMLKLKMLEESNVAAYVKQCYDELSDEGLFILLSPTPPTKYVLNDAAILSLMSLDVFKEQSEDFLKSSKNWTNW